MAQAPFMWFGQMLYPEHKVEWRHDHGSDGWSVVTADSKDADAEGGEPSMNHMEFLRETREENITGYRWPVDLRWVAYNAIVTDRYEGG